MNAGHQELTNLLGDLVAIESVNPAYPGGNRGEAAVATFVEVWCRELGLQVRRQAVLPGRDNVLAELRVPGAHHTLLFEAHMDTVGLDSQDLGGLQPEVRDGRLYGRGACDTKGSLAAMLWAMQALIAHRAALRANVLLLAAVDEEHQFRGVTAFVDSGYQVHAAVVGEPTDLRIVVAHKGCVRWRLATVGRAAHSSRPADGINAIDQMADVLRALRQLQPRLRERHHALVGSPTLSVGRIWGGTGVNVVPARCVIEIDRRTIPGETAEEALAEVDDVLATVCATDPTIRIEREPPFVLDWPLATPTEASIVEAARAACQSAGLDPAPVGVGYGTDASKLWVRAGVPSIVLGPGSIAQAHAADEYVTLHEVARAAGLYADLAQRWSAGLHGA